MLSPRPSREAQRLLSSSSSTTDDFDGCDKEALSEHRSAPFRKGRLRNHFSLALFSVSPYSGGIIFRALGWLIVLAATVIFIESNSLGLFSKSSQSAGDTEPVSDTTLPARKRYQKPVGPKIIGLIFYGRRDRAAVLDCYVKQNLVVNGGWLDEVIWGVNTNDADDLVYLEEIIPTAPFYRQLQLEETGYVNLWNQSVERGNIYIKIDDDVVYIHEDTIPLIVHTLVTESKAALVSANVINSPEHNWIHYRSGAVHPYLPELEAPSNESLSTLENPIWKVSDLPSWIGPGGWTSPPVGDFSNALKDLLPLASDEEIVAGLLRHRWLPLEDPLDISKTPIAQTSYNAFGPGWSSWAIAAQQHYSFLYNLEMGQLSSYYMNHGFGENSSAIWDHTGDRLSINLLAVTGDMILDNIDHMAASESDEMYLTVDLPSQVNKREWIPHRLVSAANHSQAC
jgi:hypothetical protein